MLLLKLKRQRFAPDQFPVRAPDLVAHLLAGDQADGMPLEVGALRRLDEHLLDVRIAAQPAFHAPPDGGKATHRIHPAFPCWLPKSTLS
jgi:hypothetical protein